MSSRHTPTTHDVREAWLTAEYEERDPAFTSDDDIRGEFDRWLAAHDAEVRASVAPEIGMPCASTKPHPAHAWQMSATGWCLCAGVVAAEPEWETERAVRWNGIDFGPRITDLGADEADILTVARTVDHAEAVERRVTPWVPVKKEGAA